MTVSGRFEGTNARRARQRQQFTTFLSFYRPPNAQSYRHR